MISRSSRVSSTPYHHCHFPQPTHVAVIVFSPSPIVRIHTGEYNGIGCVRDIGGRLSMQSLWQNGVVLPIPLLSLLGQQANILLHIAQKPLSGVIICCTNIVTEDRV